MSAKAVLQNIQGHHAMAGSHIRSGSNLLKGIVYDHRNDASQLQTLAWKRQVHAYVPLASLVAIFAVLNKEAAMVRRSSCFAL